ncbi:MAG TPA: hypothetical protein VG184_02290 [Acidimicrobiales bacterium]|nr:hypothetical protein [Acidimicrobiales bacterium]
MSTAGDVTARVSRHGGLHAPRASVGRRVWTAWRRVPVSFQVVGLIGAVLIFLFIRFTVDDAFISWRYALTLVRSGQWNYTAGIPRVEGYTDFLYTVVAIVPAALHIPIELFYKVVSLLILGGYLVVVRRGALGRTQKLALAAIVLCNPAFMIMLFSGLETVSFSFGVALLFALVYRNGGLGRLGYAVALAVALSRPEGVAFAGIAMLWSLVITRRRAQWVGFAAVGAAWCVYWLARWSYFGFFWPGAYYIKAGSRGAVSVQVVNVLDGLVPAVVVAGLVLLVAALIPQIDRRAVRHLVGTPQDTTPLVLALTSAAVVLGLYHSSNLEMDFVNRFQWQLLFPVVLVALSRPLGARTRLNTAIAAGAGSQSAGAGSQSAGDGPPRLTVRFTTRRESRPMPSPAEFWALLALVVATVTALADEPGRLGQIAVTGAAIVVAVAVILRAALGNQAATILAAVALAVVVSSSTVGELVTWGAYRIRLQNAHQALGQVINAAPFDGAVAIGDAGLLPFKLHQPVIDLGGLASAPLAHGTLTTADLVKDHLDLVVALSGSPAAGSQWSVGTGEVVFVYMLDQHWPSSGGPPFNNGYWLDYWINPAVNTPKLDAAIARVTARAITENLQSDSTILGNHLLDFPFLTNTNS